MKFWLFWKSLATWSKLMQTSFPTGSHRKPRPPLPPIPRLISWQYQILNPRSTSSTHHFDICIMDNFDSVCQYLNWFDYRPSRKLFCKHAGHTTWYIVCTILEMGSTVTIVPYVNFLWHCFYRNRYVEKKNHVMEYSGISSSKSQLF